MQSIAQYEICYQQYLDAEGKPTQDLPAFASNTELLIELYESLVAARLFDTKAINLQRTGKMGTYAASKGQEAISVALGAALKPEDVYVPSYRDYPTLFRRGIKMSEILLYWGGDERGSCYDVGGEDFPLCVPIATQCLHASGIATAMKIRGQQRAVAVTIGDGGTSKGDFYEAMNVAGVWALPVVFVVCNNGWAISVPRAKQTAAQTFAQKALAAGIENIQVDGNDVIAMLDVAQTALARARQEHKPFVIEALTYRMHDHTTADDATRYRSTEEVKEAEAKDPIIRLRNYLHDLNLWDQEKEQALHKRCSTDVENAVSAYLSAGTEPVTAMFDSLYATLPVSLEEQRNLAQQFGGRAHG